ncbi:MAG TPA: winged helix-turn-helix domain-containing protein [Terracidiphilus sp.]|nr:winged helix-turn-helix domain-containing protein [Terracidiphilus sp.]
MAFAGLSPVRFGLFEFDPESGDLRRRGLSVRLTPQARMLLRVLLEAPIRTHNREEIQRRLWGGDTFVDFEHGVNKVVHSLREALGESARNPRFIETVAAEGYGSFPPLPKRDPRRSNQNSPPSSSGWPFSH